MRVAMQLCRVLALVASIIIPASVVAQTYPAKPVRMVVPFPGGGVVDILGRILAEQISANWGQQVVVEPKPGGNTMIGTEAVLNAPPDGYTWLLVAQTHAVNAAIFPDLRWDPARDFIGAGLFARTVPYLIVPASASSKTLAEFVARAKSEPGKLNYGHAGIGSPPHLGFELFKRVAGLDIQAIPYKGNPQIQSGLISGLIDAALLSSISIAGPAKAGQIRPLAVMGAKRSARFPDVPSVVEAGLPDAQTASWFGVVLHAKTPPDIVKRIANEIEKAAMAPGTAARLDKLGAELAHLPPAAFDELIRRDIATWKRLVKEAGIKTQ